MRSHVILAVFKRNVASYFNSVLGYLFIVVFVVAGAALAFSPQFFTNNLATLDQLNEWFPMLLLFLVPAITMGAWSDEKRSGTEELLFTLPASDVEILLGKYLAVLSVYSVALPALTAKVTSASWSLPTCAPTSKRPLTSASWTGADIVIDGAAVLAGIALEAL